jgi:hypothetical protein
MTPVDAFQKAAAPQLDQINSRHAPPFPCAIFCRRGFPHPKQLRYEVHIELKCSALLEKVPAQAHLVAGTRRRQLEAVGNMTSPLLRGLAVLVLTLAPMTGAVAQVSTDRVAANTDWSVFAPPDEPKTCWAVSAPKETVNSKDGQPVAVRRGDILLFVTYFANGAAGEISFTGGYPFAPGSTVGLDVGGTKFDLFTDGEWAWAGSKDDDTKIMTAMRAGASAILTAQSARGTQTQDTFSLLGFTASVDEAAKRCAG